MKFSLNMAQKFSNVDLKSLNHSEIVTKMGLQLGAIEQITEWGDKYKDIIIVKIVEFQKHPDADKLTVCKIDDGGTALNVERDENGLVQVVCGAPNVKGGISVVWIPPGAIVPSTLLTDPFTLEAREIRGKVSNGMLASPKELDISDEHEGILIVSDSKEEKEPIIGENVTNYFGLDDFIVDCENKMFTHRPDCFGNLGIARELSGIFGLKFESPEWYSQTPTFVEAGHINLESENKIPDLVPRFSIVAMSGLKVGKSPVWMQSYLKRVGIKPINNIVDVTNFIMHLTGQPLHAFDLNKLVEKSGVANKENVRLQPRMAKAGEELLLLGDKKIVLDENDIVIATDENPVALAGVMGGAETEVDENTSSIVIECANFDMYSVRRTSMRHGLFTDAVTRFNKGQSPLQNDKILAYAMQLMTEYSGATQSSKVIDITSFDKNTDNLNKVEISAEFINKRLGTELSDAEIKTLLENVEFIVELADDNLHVTVPFWRMDISLAEDVVEEVGRLYGYDKVPVNLPLRIAKPTPKNIKRNFKQSLRENLELLGANEVLSYSFVHGNLLDNAGIKPEQWSYHLRNALSPDLQYYRPALIPSLLSKVHPNIKAQSGSDNNQFALYELGKAHIKNELEEDDSGLPKELNRLSLVVAADDKTSKKYQGSAYYHAKQYLDRLTNNQASYKPLENYDYPMTASYLSGRAAEVWVGDILLGVIGEFHSKIKKHLKLPNYCAGFEIDIDMLRNSLKANEYEILSVYPSSTQDITFEVKDGVSYSDITNFLEAEAAVSAAEENIKISIEPISIYQAEDSKNRRISYRYTFTHNQKTMKTEEINSLLDHFAGAVHEKNHAKRI